MDGEWPAKATSALVVVEDGVKARSVSVEEEFAPHRVEIAATFGAITEQGLGISFKCRSARVKAHSADVYHDPVIVFIVINTLDISRLDVISTCCDVIDCDADVIGWCDTAGR